jgi:hypothetical protein
MTTPLGERSNIRRSTREWAMGSPLDTHADPVEDRAT